MRQVSLFPRPSIIKLPSTSESYAQRSTRSQPEIPGLAEDAGGAHHAPQVSAPADDRGISITREDLWRAPSLSLDHPSAVTTLAML